MGVVYMALDTELNRWVAFKLVRALGDEGTEAPSLDGASSPENASAPPQGTAAADTFRELEVRFLQEAWITGGLEHPGIVPVYELGKTSGGVPFYTMRLVRGARTLEDAIKEVREAPVEERLALLEPFLKLCDTVRYAHDKGVIHRDLKPANIALGEYGETVLLDWGLAKLEGEEDLTGSTWKDKIHAFRKATDAETMAGAMGTPGYMSPEAALGELDAVDRRSDVYSLGAILFEILTNRLPFEFTGYLEFVSKVAAEDAPEATALEASAPTALSDLCAQALSRDPDARPLSADALATSIRDWQAESALEREVEGLLGEARGALQAAEDSTGAERLAHVDRAAAGLVQVEAKTPGSRTTKHLLARAERLREEGISERERATGRRLLKRVGVAALALASIVAVWVGFVIDGKRQDAEDARKETRAALTTVKAERNLKSAALDRVLRLSDSKKVRDLLDETAELWPVHPDVARRMSEWIDRANAVLENRTDHEETLATMKRRGSASARSRPTPSSGLRRSPRLRCLRSTADSRSSRKSG